MKEFFSGRLVRAVFAWTGLVATMGGPMPTTPAKLQPFASDGCSVFPDGNTYACCYVHDMAYWAGGTAGDRRKADRALQQCVADVSGNRPVGHAIGGLMYAAVTIFGAPGVPTKVSWGYGWEATRQTSYNAMTPAEQDQVTARKQEACKTLTLDPDNNRYKVDDIRWLRTVDVQQMCSPPPASTGRR